MRAIDLSNVTWRKSSYSNSDGGNCIEVFRRLLGAATWRKSSYSNQDGGNCVEVADGFPALVPVRDSKAPHGPALLFEASAWASFVTAVKDGQLPASDVPPVARDGPQTGPRRSPATGAVAVAPGVGSRRPESAPSREVVYGPAADIGDRSPETFEVV